MAQTLLKPQRYRGFVLTLAGLTKLQAQINTLETKTKLRQNSRTIAERVQLLDPDGIHPITVRKILQQQGGVDKRSICCVFEALELELQEGDYAHANLSAADTIAAPVLATTALLARRHWGEAIDITHFDGRVEELVYLQQRLMVDRCRLITLSGMVGSGKTALAIKFAQNVEHLFEVVVWRSLRHAPSASEEFSEILRLLLPDQSINGSTIRHLTRLLLDTLQRQRCLLVLDELDCVLQGKVLSGHYLEGYEMYGELLRLVAEVPHQSCVVVTTCELPKEFKVLHSQQVCGLKLGGLKQLDSRSLFARTNLIEASEAEWCGLNDYYAGNPRLLKMVISCIEEYFGGNVSDYLQELQGGGLVLSDLKEVLIQPFNRLSSPEADVLQQLALQRQWRSLSQIRSCEPLQHWHYDLLEVLDSLNRRSLIEKTTLNTTKITPYVVNERRTAYFRVPLILADYLSRCTPPAYAVA